MSELLNKVRLKLFEFSIQKLKVGSDKWLKVQEKLNKGAPIGHDFEKRNLFYSKTLEGGAPNIKVHPHVVFYFPENIKIKGNVLLGRNVFITARSEIKIGENSMIGPFTVINSGNHNFIDVNNTINSQGHNPLPILIEDDVWIGANCSILSGVKIGKGAIIGAGSVVTKNIDDYSIAVGVPAKEIRNRKEGNE